MPAETIIEKFESEAEIHAMRKAVEDGPSILQGVGSADEIEHGVFECFKPSRALERAFKDAVRIARAAAPRQEAAAQSTPAADAPATEKQVAFINRLMHCDPAYASNFVTDPTRLTKRQASQVIDNLLAGV